LREPHAKREYTKRQKVDDVPTYISKFATAPIQLPCKIYTLSNRRTLKWIAELVYVDDRFGSSFVRHGEVRKRAAYIVRILGVYQNKSSASKKVSPTSLDSTCSNQETTPPVNATELKLINTSDLEPYHQALIGKVVTSLTKCNEIIQRRAEKCSASGWNAWKILASGKEIKTQKKQKNKKTNDIVYIGGGFLNPTKRNSEQVAAYLKKHHLPPTAKLPSLTQLELRDFWYSQADIRGGIQPFL
ncbi:unnamed protein product, partial [marine sediment metagenome]